MSSPSPYGQRPIPKKRFYGGPTIVSAVRVGSVGQGAPTAAAPPLASSSASTSSASSSSSSSSASTPLQPYLRQRSRDLSAAAAAAAAAPVKLPPPPPPPQPPTPPPSSSLREATPATSASRFSSSPSSWMPTAAISRQPSSSGGGSSCDGDQPAAEREASRASPGAARRLQGGAEGLQLRHQTHAASSYAAAESVAEQLASRRADDDVTRAVEGAARKMEIERLAAEARAAVEQRAAEDAARKAEQERQAERDAARAAADEAERQAAMDRLAAETRAAEEARVAAEEAMRRLEQQRLAEREAAEEAAREAARVEAARQAEESRRAAEARALEAEAARRAAEEAMRRAEQQLREEREAAEEAARAAADEAARKVEAERLAAEARTVAAEEARRAAEEAMRKAEQERQAEREAAEEAARAAAEDAERQAALDRLAAETRAAEEARVAAEEAMRRVEQQRIAEREVAEEAAREAARVEAARQAEESRRAAEARALEADIARQDAVKAAQRAEQQLQEEREAAEEAARAAADEAARKVEAERLAAEARTAAAEEARRAAEEAMRKAEQERQAEREAARAAAEEAERQAAMDRLAAETRAAEEARVAAEEAKRRVEQQLQEEREAAEEAARAAADEVARKVEAERLAAEARTVAAEEARRAAEEAVRKAEQERQAEREAARAAAEDAERQAAMDRLAAETRAAEEARVAAEEAMRRAEQQLLEEREAAEEAARAAADEAARKVEAERLAAEARTAAAVEARRAAEEAMRKAEQERQAEREAARAAAEEAARQAALDRLAAETRAAEEARQAAEEAMQRIEQQRLAEREAAEEAAREAARVEAARQAEESRRAAEARALEAEAARRAAEEAMRRAEQQLREEREAAEEAARAAADEAARKVEAERLAAEARTAEAEEARRAAEEAMRKAEQERQAEREAAEEAARRLAVERKDADRKAFVERRVAEAEVARVSAEAALRREARRADGRSDASEGGASATGRRRLRSEASAAGSRRSSRHSSRRGVVGVASSRSSSSARSSPQPSSRASSLSFVEATEARTLSTVRSSFPGRPHVRSAAAVLPAAASVSSVSAPAELLQLPQQRFDSHHRTAAAAAAATHNAPYADDSASLLRYDSVRTEVSMASEAVDEEGEGSCAAAASGSGVGGNDGDVLANTGGLNSSHGCMDAMLCDEEGDAASLDAHYEGGVDMDGDSLGCSNTAHSNSLLVVGPSPAGTPVRGERAAEERSVSEDHGSTLSLSRTGLGDTGTLVLTQNTAMVENLRTTTSSCADHSAESTPASKTSEVAQSVPAIGTAEAQQQQQQQQEPAAAAKSDPAPSMLLGQNRGVTLSPPQSHFSATGHTEPCMLLTPEQVVAAIAEDWDREKQEDDDDDRDVQFSTRIKPAALDGFALGGAYPEDVSSSTLHSSDIGEIMARERQQPSGPSTPALACSVEVQSPTPPPDTPPPDALPSESVETAKPTPVELPATTAEAAAAAAAAATAEAVEVAAAAAAVAAVAAVAEQPPADVLTEDAREAEPASPGQLPPAEEGTGEASSDGAPDAAQTKDSAKDPAVHADHESAPEETAEGAGAEDQPPADAVPEVDAIASAAAAVVTTADAAAARAQLLQVDVAEVAASTSSSMEALPPLSPPRGQQAAAAAAANTANTSGETLFSPAASKDRVSCPSEDDEGGDGTLSRCVSVTGPSIENSSYCDREFLVTTNYTIASDLPLVFTKSEGGSDAADSQSVASAACSVPASPPAAAAPARAPFDDCSGGSGGTPPLDPLARVLELSSVQATNNDSSMKTTTPTGLFSDPETCDSTAVVRGGRSTMDGDSDTTESSALHPTPPTGSCGEPPVEVADAQDVLPETPAAGKVEAAAPEAQDTVGTLASESSQSCPSGGPAVVQPETPAAARDADTTAVQCCDTDEQPSETQEELNAAAQPRIESSDSESDDAGSEAAQSDTSSAAGEAAPDSPASARESEPSARADTSLVAASPVVRCEGSDAASEGSEAEAECEVVALPAPKEIPSAFEEPSAEREEDDVEPVQATPPTSAAADGQSLAEPPVPQQPEEEDTQPASPEATEAADARSPSPSSSQSQSKSGEAKPVQPDVRPGTAEPLPSQASPFTIAPPPMPSLTDMQCDATYTESLPASPTSPGGPITPARGDRNKGSNPALSFTPSSPVHSSQKPTEEPEHKSVSLQELVQMYPANAFQQSRIRTLSCLSDAASETSHIGIQSGQNSQMTIWGTVLRQTGSQCLKGSEDDNGSDCIGQLSPRTEKTLDAPGSSDNTDIDVDAHVDTLNASLSASQHTMATSTTGSSTSSASRHAGSEPPHEEPGPQRAAGSPSPPPPAAPTVPLLRTHDVINRQEAIAAAAVQPSYADFIGLNITPASPREEKPRRMVATPGKIAPVPQAPRSPSTSPTPASPSLRRARAHSLSAASTESYESRSPLSGTILAARQALGRGSHKEVAEALGNVVDQVQQSGPTNPFAQRLLQDLSRSTSNVAPTPESITLAPSKTKTQAMALSMLEEHLRLIDEGYDEYDDEDDEEDEEDELSADYGEAEDLLEPMTLCFKGGRDVVGAKATKAAEQYDSVMPGCENYCYTVKLPPATPMPLDIAKHLAETGRVDPSSITTDTTAEGLTELTIRHGMMGPDMLKETLANVVKDLSMDDVTIDSQDGCQELVENLIDWYTDKPGDLITELTTNLRFPPAVRTRQQKKKALAKISRSMEDLAKNAGINAVEAMVLRQYTQKPMDLDRDLGWSGVPMPPANDRDLAGKICVSEYEKTYCDWDWSQHMMDPQKRNGSLFGPICAALRDQGPNGTWSAWSEAVIRKWIKWLMCIAAVTLRTTPEHLDRTLYRGLGAGGLPLHVVLSHRCMPRGSKLTWPALSSLSYNNEQSTAYMFGRAANSTNKPNPEKPGTILFAMKGVSSGLALASLSQYPEEDELLLGPLITFEVDEVKEDRENPFDAGLRINLKCVGLLGGTTGDSTNREMLEGFLDEVTDDVFMAMMALMPSLSPAGSPRPVPASPAMRGSWRKLSRKFSSPLMSGAPSSATPSRTHAMSPFMAPSVASSPQTPMVPPSGLAGTMGASSGRGSSASPEREMTPVLHRDPSELSLKGGRRAAPGKKGWVRHRASFINQTISDLHLTQQSIATADSMYPETPLGPTTPSSTRR